MDERTALAVTAVRAVELSDRGRAVWTDADRAWASRAAAETVGRGSARAVRRPSRAARTRAVVPAQESGRAVGACVALASVDQSDAGPRGLRARCRVRRARRSAPHQRALFAGGAAGRVEPRDLRRACGGLRPALRDRGCAGPLRSGVAWLAGVVRGNRGAYDQTEARASSAFAEDWTRLATPLYAARAARTLHVAAAALALGVVAGLYLRGLGTRVPGDVGEHVPRALDRAPDRRRDVCARRVAVVAAGSRFRAGCVDTRARQRQRGDVAAPDGGHAGRRGDRAAPAAGAA